MAQFWFLRAQTPTAIAGRTSTGFSESIRILRGFDAPLGATLVPLEEKNGRYVVNEAKLLEIKGEYWDRNLVRFRAPEQNGLFELPQMPWPGDAERALLLLFYLGPEDQGGIFLGGGIDTHFALMSEDAGGATSFAGGAPNPDALLRFFGSSLRVQQDGAAVTRQDVLDALQRFFMLYEDGLPSDHVALLYRAAPGGATSASQQIAAPIPGGAGSTTPGGGASTTPGGGASTTPGGASSTAPPLRFALASCQYPGGIIDRSLGTDVPGPYSVGVSDRSWFRLSQLPDDEWPSLLIVAGDQVYVDATAGMFDPKTLDDGMRGAYRSLRANRGYTAMFNRPIERVSMIDDHEIEDNWEPLPHERMDTVLPPGCDLVTGACSYIAEVRQQALGEIKDPYALRPQQTCLAFDFTRGGHRFLLADTRTEREGRDARNMASARIMGPGQWRRLCAFIEAADTAPAFIVTPSIVLPRQLAVARQPSAALMSDGWDGYPASLHALLAILYAQGRGNVVFLSGDAHLSCAARITLYRPDDPKRVVVHSVHGSALYAPFPFANSGEHDFARAEDFAFPSSGLPGAPADLRCAVETYFPHAGDRLVGDGFVLVATRRDGEHWAIDVTFDGEHGRDACVLAVP